MNLRMAVQFRLAAGILVYAAVRESNRKGEGICVIPYSSNTVGSSLKGIKYEDGGGYRIHYRGDGYLQYHPAGAHHIEAYYKRSSAKDGVRRYKLDGSEKDD